MIHALSTSYDFNYEFPLSLDVSKAHIKTYEPHWRIKNSINSRLSTIMNSQNIALGKIYHYNEADGTTNHP